MGSHHGREPRQLRRRRAVGAGCDRGPEPRADRITGAYSGPQPATAQSGLSFTGHVDALTDGQWQGNSAASGSTCTSSREAPPRGPRVTGSCGGAPRATTTSTRSRPTGGTGTSHTLAQGSWQARVEPDRWTGGFLPHPGHAVDVTVQTAVTQRTGHRRSTYAPRTRRDAYINRGPRCRPTWPVGCRAVVKVYYHAKGSTTWRYLTTATTASPTGVPVLAHPPGPRLLPGSSSRPAGRTPARPPPVSTQLASGADQSLDRYGTIPGRSSRRVRAVPRTRAGRPRAGRTMNLGGTARGLPEVLRHALAVHERGVDVVGHDDRAVAAELGVDTCLVDEPARRDLRRPVDDGAVRGTERPAGDPAR